MGEGHISGGLFRGAQGLSQPDRQAEEKDNRDTGAEDGDWVGLVKGG